MQHLPHEPAARRAAIDRAIEWETLPSLAYLLGRDRDTAHNEPVWADTMPSEFDLDARAPSEDFIEPLPGLEIREVHEPDIFRLFFAA
ncbi:MAG TPA: hypothetical protein VF453_10655 [Burkholderiaceae bacterium]